MRETEIQYDYETVEEKREVEHIYCDDCRGYLKDEDDVCYEIREVCPSCRSESDEGLWYGRLTDAEDKLEKMREEARASLPMEEGYDPLAIAVLAVIVPVALAIDAVIIYNDEAIGDAILHLTGFFGGILWTLLALGAYVFLL